MIHAAAEKTPDGYIMPRTEAEAQRLRDQSKLVAPVTQSVLNLLPKALHYRLTTQDRADDCLNRLDWTKKRKR